MSYCVVSDIEALMGIKFGHHTGRPTYEEVEDDFIVRVAARLDGVAQAAGYTVPVTSTQALALMKTMNAYGAACAIWHAGYVSQAAPARVEYWCDEYRQFLTDLRKGDMDLPGEDPEGDLDPVFGIAQSPARDGYFTGEDEDLD